MAALPERFTVEGVTTYDGGYYVVMDGVTGGTAIIRRFMSHTAAQAAADHLNLVETAEPRDGRPSCPYCGELAPYGDARLPWLGWHIDSRIHRWWQALKRKYGRAS